jgi:hypothetical protein
MAYINISMGEFARLIDKNVEYDRERIKSIDVMNENQVVLTVSIGPFFPDMKVALAFNRFEKGKAYFNVLSGGAIKMIIGLLNEINTANDKNVIRVKDNNLVMDINEVICESLKGTRVKNMSVSGDQIYITLSIE